MSNYHIPAMPALTIEGLNIKAGGIYVDVTFGGGGHSREILTKIGNGKLVAFDRDKDAIQNNIEDDRFILIHNNFIYLKRYLRYLNALPVQGILADLGVSSHQFDTAEKGFSYRFNVAPDMRMDKDTELTAAYILNHYSAQTLQKIFGMYGEIKNAAQLSQKIVETRKSGQFNTIKDLVDVARLCMHRNDILNKYLSKIFQALRIAVNDEINSLKHFLLQSKEVLEPGGRLVILTYHSIEDRIVKNFIKTGTFSGKVKADILYGNVSPPFRMTHKKPLVPAQEETQANPRIRSAKLRIAEKIN